MTPYASFVPNSAFALLLQGPPGSGKTTTALNWPGAYILDCDQNLDGPVEWHKKHTPNWPGFVGFDTVESGDTGFGPTGRYAAQPQNWLRVIELTKVALREPTVKTLVVDSLTKFTDYLCDFIIFGKPSTEDKNKMTIGDWIPFKTLMARYVAMCRSAHKTVIFCCHEKALADEVTDVVGYVPNIPGQLAGNLGSYFTDVWRCETALDAKSGKYVNNIRTRKTPRLELKCSKELPDVFPFSWPLVATALGLTDNKTTVVAK
jgi:DNA polymerase III delta prime subunit